MTDAPSISSRSARGLLTAVPEKTLSIPPQTALILEGGGMRGVYTAGVLRWFTDAGLDFPYVIGVSMGACNGANYISRQPERNRIVNIRFVDDARFLSFRRLLFGGELFGMGFIFTAIPTALVPFDLKTFLESDQRFIIVATDGRTGEAVYYDKDALGAHFLTVLQAGCSLPLVQKPVALGGRLLMDGGLADAVPIARSVADGNRRHVLVLTQPKGYRKKPSGLVKLMKFRYPHLTGLADALTNRHHQYNRSMAIIDAMEANGTALVIRPRSPLVIGRVDRNKNRLYAGYDEGYNDAARCAADLKRILS